MAVDATGDWGQPGFLDSGFPDIAVDPTAVSNYYATLVPRRFATASALLGSTPPAAHYTAVAENVPGAFFRYTGSAWTMHGTAEFATVAARDLALTAPAAGWLSRVATERWVRRAAGVGTSWRPWGAGQFKMVPTGFTGTGTGFTIDSNGDANFAGATAFNLEGLFTSDFLAYLVIVDVFTMPGGGGGFVLRKGGVSNNAAKYTTQRSWGQDAAAWSRDIAANATSYAPIPQAAVEHTVTCRVTNPMVASLPTKLAFETDSYITGASAIKAFGPGRHDVTDAFDGIGWTFGGAATGRVQAWGLL